MKKFLACVGIATSILTGAMLPALPASAASDSEITPKIWTFYNDYSSLSNCITAGEEHLHSWWRTYDCDFSNDGSEYQWDLSVDWM